jgi:hypothetical protein
VVVAPGAAVGAATAGTPLPAEVAEPIATSLGVDLSSVRVHSDGSAAQAARAFGARAFAIGSNVFLGQGERATDLRLMAHEVAHVVQQRAARTVQTWTNKMTDRSEREADRASAAVARRESFSIREHVSSRVQRLGISDALDYFADKANVIPGFRMLTILIGVNPINMSRVERSAANILRAIVEFIPGGVLITQALDKYGVFERAGAWTEQQLTTLGMTGAMFREALDRFLDSLSWRDIFHLGDVWDRAKRIFMDPISRIINFVVGLGVGILRLIRDAILRPLARLAEGTRGWDLLKAVLGQDPITGEPVPRNADTLVGGFMKLIGQEEVWNNIKRANAIPRAWAWFQGALAELLGFVRQIPAMFIGALRELEIADIVLLPRAFAKVGRVFLGFAGNFFSWALRQVLSLLQIIFEVVAPAVMPYVRKAMGAFRQIIQHPVGFVGNLVRAGVQGFRQFMGNFLSHLRRSLIQWLTGTLEGAGIYIPQAFELREIIKFVLSVLGLTWQNVRGKLLRLIPEPVLSALETGFDIVVTLVREGPAAAWEKIREQLSNLKDMVMEQIMSFVRESIVTAAITKLLTSLNPAGAFIQAIIAIYNTIMFFVERLRQIGQVVASFIDSISAIASGAIGAAANRVEQTMAGFLTLVISFLARLVGLGRVSDAVKKIVDRIRAPIDKALDRVVEWIVATAKKAGRLLASGGRGAIAGFARLLGLRKNVVLSSGEQHSLYFEQSATRPRLFVATNPVLFEAFVNSIPGSRATDGDKRAAIAFIREIDRLEDETVATQVDNADRIRAILEELTPIVQALMGRAARLEMRSTPPEYAGLTPQGLARGMRVTLVTNELRRGSPPDVSNAVYLALARRREGNRVYYIKGHLLNENLGGPGGVPQNLTPLSQRGNQQHLLDVENIIKPRQGTVPRAFLYVVTPGYGRPLNTALIAAIEAASNPDSAATKALKVAIVTAEQFVPMYLVCSIREIDPESGRGRGEMETRITVPVPVDQSSPSSYVL